MSKRKLIGVAAAGLITLVVFITIHKFVFGVADGTITTAVATPSTLGASEKRLVVSDKLASFSYPSNFVRLQSEAASAPVLQRYNFIKRQFGTWQIAIQITHLQSGSLDDDGTYYYRNETPSRFVREQRTIGLHQVIIFSDKVADQAFSKVAYLHEVDKSASISFMGGTTATADQLQTELDALIASWHWK